MSKTIVKLENLSSTFYADSRFVTIGISGPFDHVRIAARDLIYGLGIIWSVDGKVDHVSETLKMQHSPLISDDEDYAQIEISLSVKQFDRIVTLFRYCAQVGLSLMTSEEMMMLNDKNGRPYAWSFTDESGVQVSGLGTLGEYLSAIKNVADRNHDIIQIEKDEKPLNRLFWTKAEIAADAQAREAVYKGKKTILGFFGDSMSTIERRKELIELKKEKIYALAEAMFMSHPKNPNNFSLRLMARDALYQYLDMKHHSSEDPFVRYPHQFMLVRDDDREKFAALANKLQKLNDELSGYEKAEQEAEKDFDSVMTCPIL